MDTVRDLFVFVRTTYGDVAEFAIFLGLTALIFIGALTFLSRRKESEPAEDSEVRPPHVADLAAWRATHPRRAR